MNKIAKFAKTSAIYFLGQVAVKIISFFLLPLYSDRFSTTDYGNFDYATAILNVVVPLVCLEIWSCILRYIFDYEEAEGKYGVVSNGLSIFLVSVAVYTVGFVVIRLFFAFEYATLIYLYGLTLMLQNLFGNIARGMGKNMMYMLSGVVSSTALIVINIILIVGFNRSVDTLFISGIISGLIQVVMLECSVKAIGHFRLRALDRSMIGSMLRFSGPLCVNTVAFWLLTSYSRLPIKEILGDGQVGIFGMASRFTVILSLFVSIFNMAWQELTFSIGNEEGRSNTYSHGIDLLLKFLGCGMLLLIPFTKVAFDLLINEAYQEALDIIPLYYLGTLASSFSSFLGNIFSAEKRNGTIFFSTAAAALVNVSVIHLTIRPWGLQGVTLALCLGFFVNVLIRILFLRKQVDLKINVKFLVSLGVMFGASTLVFYLAGNIVNIVWFVLMGLFALYVFRDLLRMAWEKLKDLRGRRKAS